MLKAKLEFVLPHSEKMWGAPGNPLLLQVGKEGRHGLKYATEVTGKQAEAGIRGSGAW